MIVHPNFDPVAISIGPLSVHWYGLMYLLGFGAGLVLGRYRAGKSGSGWKEDEIFDLVFFMAMGAVLGGRLGYVLFYNPGFYMAHPLDVVAVWDGGMSFHGGLLGVLAAIPLYAKKTQRRFFDVSDFLAPLVPAGLFFGRLGNFINQELWGRPTEMPWGVLFHTAPDAARHPSQLYEAGLEGLVLFVLLWWYAARPRPAGKISGLFLAGYGLSRFFVEFFREPDGHLGSVLLDWVTMGQLLSLPMILAGWYLFAARTAKR
ncbi:MAG: prolipoprotein diacylglyceryl transferase [Gammaproteobacteria bacterium]|nr:prolipoprotein diacylglyceryl transferase [Gammaproteobacteria bacterium]